MPRQWEERKINLQVACGHVVLDDERLLGLDDLVDAIVRVESGLDVVEKDDGAVRASAAELAVGRHRGREADRVVESQAKRLVRLLSALAAVEQVLLQVIDDGEERAARRIRRGMDTVRARDTLCECGWREG